MDIAPVTHEVWEAFIAERKCWEIAETGDVFIATDRPRYLNTAAFSNPMDESFISETFETKGQAQYFIGLNSMNVALAAVGIIHADA